MLYSGVQKLICSRNIHRKTVQASPGEDALQQTDLDGAIESFRRCKFGEIFAFFGPWGSPRVPRLSKGRAQGSQRRPWGVPGACPPGPWRSQGTRGTLGTPRDRWDPFHNDNSVVEFDDMIS